MAIIKAPKIMPAKISPPIPDESSPTESLYAKTGHDNNAIKNRNKCLFINSTIKLFCLLIYRLFSIIHLYLYAILLVKSNLYM